MITVTSPLLPSLDDFIPYLQDIWNRKWLTNNGYYHQEIKNISEKLADAGIDIIEMGFLRDGRDVEYLGDTTFFTEVHQITPFLDNKKQNVLYTAFIDYGMCNIDNLDSYDGTSIDAIRLGFTKKNYDENNRRIFRRTDQ